MGFPGDSLIKILIPGLGRSLEKEMATHSSILAQKIPWTEKPVGLQSMELQNNRTRVTKQQQLSIS